MTLSLRMNDLARIKPPRLIDSDQKGVAKGSPGVNVILHSEPYRSEWYRAAKGTFI